MRKYKISLYTKGAECYIHKISEDQKSKLIEIDVEGTDPDSEVVSEILNVTDVFETDDIILGGYYDPKLFSIQVENEIGDVIWESGDNYNNYDVEYEVAYTDEGYLIVEDYIKGCPFFYEIEIEEEFNHGNIGLVVKEIGERIELITGITYNGNDLSFYKDNCDYWSKGLSYYLC